MRRYIKIISILLVSMVLFNIQGVEAISVRDSCKTSDCDSPVCQYKTGSGTNEKLVSLYVHKNDEKFEVLAQHKDEDKEKGMIYVTDYTSHFIDFEKVYSSSPGINVEELHDNFVCPNHAYFIDKKTIPCFDNDGKSCKKEWGKKIKNSYEIDEDGANIDANGNVEIDGTKVEHEKSEDRVRNRLTEQKIVIKEKTISSDSDCSGIFGEVVTADINLALKYIKYIGPVLVIVLGMLDFIKAVASGDNDAFNKAWKRLLTRLIVAILLFFVVDLIKFLFHVFGITVPEQCLK